MLSFQDNGGDVISMYDAYHKSNNKIVYYNKDEKPDDFNDLDDDLKLLLLQMEHGKTKTRTKKSIHNLGLDETHDILEAPNVKGAFIPLIIPDERFVHFVSGKSGSGKSYLSKRLAKNYKLLNYPVYIITPQKDDWGLYGRVLDIDKLVVDNSDADFKEQKRVYDEARIRLKHQKKNIKDPEILVQLELKVNELKPEKPKGATRDFKFTELYYELIKRPTLFIFDDTEALEAQGKLKFLQDSQLLTGRHDKINMIIINHLSTNGQATRNILNESNIFTIYDVNKVVNYFLENYLFLSKKIINTISRLLKESRYITIYKNQNILLSENKIIKF